jgi:hypothetical protein
MLAPSTVAAKPSNRSPLVDAKEPTLARAAVAVFKIEGNTE